MANNLPTRTANLEELEADLIKTLETDRQRGCDLKIVREKSGRYADAVRSLLVGDSTELPGNNEDRFDRVLPILENAYSG